MTREVTASAPGKLVLLGDYAVLEGATALVMAVNRRARVQVGVRSGAGCEVSAPEMGVALAPLVFGEGGLPQWPGDPAQTERLRLVDQVLRGLRQQDLAPAAGRGFGLRLDTAEFFDGAGDRGAKLGLGSSAALTVALASALAVFAGRGTAVADRRSWLEQLLRMHRGFQGGHGSGVDVAAALAGGVIAYRLLDGGERSGFEPVRWPEQVHARFVWSGRSASTSSFLERLALWRRGHGAEYASHMAQLRAIAAAGAAALGEARAADFVAAAGDYAAALGEFGQATGLEIFSPEHLRLRQLAAECGVCYKPCGAGGGDFGVVFALEPDRLARVECLVGDAGFRCLPLAIDERGLELDLEDRET